jgi:high-affinity nickel permease
LIAAIVVNIAAELVFYFGDVYIAMFYRIVLITGITIISAVFVGAILLVGVLEGEKPLSGNVRDTLGADKKTD